jgi:cytochrome c biogenesis protein CcdA
MEPLIALALGLLHGIEPDHLAAVSVLVMRGAGARESALAGIRFGLGHIVVLGLCGAAAVGFQLAIPPELEHVGDALGGGVLVVLGLTFFAGGSSRLRAHTHEHEHDGERHAHVHLHEGGRAHGHSHLGMALGGLFALGGVRSALLVLAPALHAGSVAGAILAVVLFGAGIFLSMALCGFVLARAAHRLSRSKRFGLRLVSQLTGLFSVAVGLVWIAGTVRSVA